MRSKTRRIMRRSSGPVSLRRNSPPVPPAGAMNEPISMWSAAMSCWQPCSSARPWTVSTLEPMPWMSAPIFTSMRARSWTCGSHAALPITVEPGVSAAASSAFSVAMTDGSSMNTSPARRRPRRTMSRPVVSISAPRQAKASRCGSSRRRPMTSPPGGGMSVWPKRASSGPASRTLARISSAWRRSTTRGSGSSAAHSATSCSERHSTRTPSPSRIRSIASTSRMRGTLRTTTSSAVRADAARMGRAAFLLPAGTTVPDNGWPPSMTNFSIRGRVRGRPEGSARVTTMSVRLSRDEAWDLLTGWVSSESLRRHCLAVSTAMEAYAERFGEDAEMWSVVGLLHDMDYERYPDLDTGHPRMALAELERMDVDPVVVRGIASHADFLGVSRDSQMEKTLFAVDELSGFLLACAAVRPDGLTGLRAKSVKKKLKQPSFAAAVNREDVRRGAEELGVDFDEHVDFVAAALESRADELLPAAA